MPKFKCPRCHTQSIPFKDKYLSGRWMVIYCSHCKAKLCAYPILLGVLYVFYVWDILWFIGLFDFTRNYLDFVYMVLGWLVLDAINLYFIPLAVMKGSPRY